MATPLFDMSEERHTLAVIIEELESVASAWEDSPQVEMDDLADDGRTITAQIEALAGLVETMHALVRQ